MRNTLNTLCENFISNRDTIKSTFSWESTYLYPVCAAIFTDKRQVANTATMINCRDILKNKVGLFSNFRGIGKLAMISMMAVDKEPDEKLKKALEVYSLMKEYFFGSQYLPLASMILTNLVQPEEYSNIAQRTRIIYNLMKSEHPFLTSSEDSVFAMLLATSELTNEQIVEETECCFRLLKSNFFSSNAVQSLSHVLALSEGSPEFKCQKTLELFNDLKVNGRKYGTTYELATLGVLATIEAGSNTIINDIIEVDNFLSTQKGYGFFGVDKKQRLMHAGMLVTSDYINEKNSLVINSSAMGATMSLIAAQQAAMVAAVAASSAAAASSASSGS